MSVAKKFIHVICGSAGDYEERSQWHLEAYAKKSDADERVKALTEIIRQMDDWLLTYRIREPAITLESTDAECELFERWNRKKDAVLGKFKKIAGDSNIDSYRPSNTEYWVAKLELK